ncbi:MAG TPA: histidine phosphatase family protein [Oscillospiraceae bacterium]|nr:histidine phosphatase family protein [Oscillospiraceae bacterium]HPS34947.1 histidine phosphatase family protein [Oscillospiraceae bacterium]
MHLYVARHGETDNNVQGKYAGSSDVPLNQNGLQQAEALAQKLADIKFDVTVSSPLARARKTAETILNRCPETPLVIIKIFAERSVGVFEGLTKEEAKNQYPELFNRWCTRQLDDAPTGGETIRQFEAGIISGLEELKTRFPDKTVLLVCHGFVSRMINKQLKGLSYEEMHGFTLNNCEVAEYEL